MNGNDEDFLLAVRKSKHFTGQLYVILGNYLLRFRKKNNLKVMVNSKIENSSGRVGKWINGNGRNQS